MHELLFNPSHKQPPAVPKRVTDIGTGLKYEAFLSDGSIPYFIVDYEDEDLTKLNWAYGKGSWTIRRRQNGKQIYFILARVIVERKTGIPLGPLQADHKNGKEWNHRRSNLRPATRKQNMANRYRNRYPGVVIDTQSGKWSARTQFICESREEAEDLTRRISLFVLGEFSPYYEHED